MMMGMIGMARVLATQAYGVSDFVEALELAGIPSESTAREPKH